MTDTHSTLNGERRYTASCCSTFTHRMNNNMAPCASAIQCRFIHHLCMALHYRFIWMSGWYILPSMSSKGQWLNIVLMLKVTWFPLSWLCGVAVLVNNSAGSVCYRTVALIFLWNWRDYSLSIYSLELGLLFKPLQSISLCTNTAHVVAYLIQRSMLQHHL